MKDSRVLTGIKTRTAKEFLSFEPEKDSNYINMIVDDSYLELLKDLADVTFLQESSSKDVTYIGICLWVNTNTFEFYLAQSAENQIMQLVARIKKVGKPYLKILIEIANFPASSVAIQKIETGTTTEYYFNPFSDKYSKNPF